MHGKKKIGLIINPVAGLGGSVGLKGTDGADIQRRARELGAIPCSSEKTALMLRELLPIKDEFSIITCPGDMGQHTVENLGFERELVAVDSHTECTADHTMKAAREMVARNVDMIAFAGGDGTARDMYTAIGTTTLVLGIPTGVKIHSGVFATHPLGAARILSEIILGRLKSIREAEVVDIDEGLYRQEILSSKLYGYLMVPAIRHSIQNRKSGSMPGDAYYQDAIAQDIIEKIMDQRYYLIGPGSTTRKILLKLGLEGSLLGVDVVYNKKLIGKDLNENQILDCISQGNIYLFLAPTGGQGFLLGRGNQQLSSTVLRLIGKDNISVVATPEKMSSLAGQPFLIDTGDLALDKEFMGYYRVTTGYHQYIIYKASSWILS